MKTIIISLLSLLSLNAFSGEYLLKLEQSSGFSPVPGKKTITLDESGKVISQQRTFQDDKIIKKLVKVVSPNLVQEVKDNIEKINARTKVIDLDANKPRCMDAPSTTVSVAKNNKDVVIGAYVACHRNEMNTAASTRLLEIARSLYQ